MRWRLILVMLACGCAADDEPTSLPDLHELVADSAEDASTDDAGVEEEDTVAPPRTPPDCGAPEFDTTTGLRRYPYLQSATHTSVRIAWTSTIDAPSMVEVADSPDGEWRAIAANKELFDVTRTLDDVDYWAYDVAIDGLAEGWTYCYRVKQGDKTLASGLHFATAWTDPARPVRILTFGDSGSGSVEQAQVRDAFMEHEFDLFLHLGDMAYGSGTFTEFETNMFDVYRDLLVKTPSWPTMGNHEAKTDGGQPYLDVYYLPEQAVREIEQERYYSFDYGDVHFVSVDSNEAMVIVAELQSLAGEDNMIEWLRQDLAASDKPWKVAFFHHPPYSSSERDPNHLVRNQILPVLEEGGVDLVLSGHDHHYERTEPIWEGALAPGGSKGLTYIVAGAAGAGIRKATGDWWTASVEDKKYSFVSLTIEGCTLTGKALSSEGEMIDEFTMDGCQN